MGRERGVMLLEAMIAILIFSMGILAIVGMQGAAIRNVTEAKHRSEASFLADEILAQMWTDAGNIAQYAYAGSGTAPARLSGWVTKVNGRLSGASNVPPIIIVTGASAQGATVQIVLRWQLPEEASLGLPPHNYTVLASVYTS